MNMYSILYAFVISVTDCWVVLVLLYHRIVGPTRK